MGSNDTTDSPLVERISPLGSDNESLCQYMDIPRGYATGKGLIGFCQLIIDITTLRTNMPTGQILYHFPTTVWAIHCYSSLLRTPVSEPPEQSGQYKAPHNTVENRIRVIPYFDRG